MTRARTVGYLFLDRNRSVNPSSRCACHRQWRMCDCETNFLFRTCESLLAAKIVAIAGLIELWFYVPLDTKQVSSETFPQAKLFA